MQFIKTRDVKSPVRDVNENAGIDFFIPENTTEFRDALAVKNTTPSLIFTTSGEFYKSSWFNIDTGEINIAPHSDIIIPTGIKSKFEPNLALIANNKSGIATKKKLIFGASVIDASYQGEWHVHLINWSNQFQVVKCGEKAIQFIPHVISMDQVEIVDQTAEEFYADSVSKRGEGWRGSTSLTK